MSIKDCHFQDDRLLVHTVLVLKSLHSRVEGKISELYNTAAVV